MYKYLKILLFILILLSIIFLFIPSNKKLQNNYKDIPKTQTQLKATFISLVRNREAPNIIYSYKSLLNAFPNAKNYPIIFFNDETFDQNFKNQILNGLGEKFSYIKFEKVPAEHWNIPKWINQEKMKENMEKGPQYPYKKSVSYRQMCRYFSGFFFRHYALNDFDYYWRVEPDVDFLCNIPTDPFIESINNSYMYGFNIAIYDHLPTIESLGPRVKFYVEYRNISIEDNKLWNWVYNSNGDYNTCHFWSNFEIGNLNFFRTSKYLDFFDFLDETGGFFYERWGDAPVHTLAASIFLKKSQIRFWDEIGYRHDGWYHLPNFNSLNCRDISSTRADNYECIKNWLQIS